MRKRPAVALVVAAAAVASGCAGPQTKYAWGSYENALYVHYKTPSETDRFAMELAKTITDAETAGQRVAPGIYAEYGHVLQTMGKYDEAIRNYEKERTAWPEAAHFMNTMIQSATAAQKKRATPDRGKS
jgi:hypothetical protein